MANNQYKYKIEGNDFYRLGLFNWKKIDKRTYIKEVDKDITNIGKTQGFNIFKYLNDKYEVDFFSGESTFGEEVSCEITYTENNVIETNGLYVGKLAFSVLVKSKNTGKVLYSPQFSTFLTLKTNVSKELLEMLFERAYSGTFEDPWLEEKIYDEMRNCGIVKPETEMTFCCGTCSQKFNSLRDLLAHLIDENHYDNILYLHRNNPEFGNLYKRLLPYKKGE